MYTLRLNSQDNSIILKRVSRSVVLRQVGRRGPQGEVGPTGPQGPPGEPGASEWGQIGGVLSDQTDLQASLDTKYDASNPDGFITAADIGVASLNTLTGDVNVTGDNTVGGVGLNVYQTTDATGDTISLHFRPLGSASGKVLISEVGLNAQSLDFDVDLVSSDVGLGNVDNTSDADKPISTATQSALDLKADSTDLGDYLAITNNLSDLDNAETARDNLDLGVTDSPAFGGLQLVNAANGVRYVLGGSTLDMDFHTDALVITGFDGPGYAGTERPKMVLKVGENTSQLVGDWEVSGSVFGMPHHWLGSTADANEARFNDDQVDADFIVKGMTDATMLYGDASTNRIGIGLAAPSDKLHVIGNFRFADAGTATKSMRFRTNGGDIDIEAAGKSVFWSVWSNPDYTGTQRNKLVMESGAENTQAIAQWQWRPSPFGTVRHIISGAAAGGVTFNEDGADTDFRVEGDTDANLLFVDASTDRVGIGTNVPDEKLHVTGKVKTTGGVLSRVVTTADDATAVIDVAVTDQYQLTAMANATTISTSGAPTAGQKLLIRLKDNGTGRGLTWDGVFRAIGVTLPTTTVANKTHYIGAVYNATDTKWDVLAVAQEA